MLLKSLSVITLLFLLQFSLPGQVNPAKGPYRASFKDVPLESALAFFEEKYGLSFSYDPAVVAPLRVSAQFTEGKLEKALARLLEGQPLSFEILAGGYVLLEPAPKAPLGQAPPPPPPLQQLCGRVLDDESGTPLPGAVAYILNSSKGSSTGPDGRFLLKGYFDANDTLCISFLGYQPINIAAAKLIDQPCGEWRLKVAVQNIPDVIVREFSMDMVGLKEGGSLSLRNDKLPTLPGWGEPDVLRTLQFLPGISSAEGSASRLNVRGGTPDQNLILWQGIPLYHTGHFFGLYDVFNPFIVKNAEVWRGNFGAYYGGRNSAVIDIDGSPELRSRSRIGAGFNLLHFNAFWEKPLKKERVTLLVALRSSYVNFIKSTSYRSAVNSVFQNGRITLQESYQHQSEFVKWSPTFSYGDLNLGLRWKGRRGADNQLSLLSGNDDFDYRFSFDDGNTLAASHDHLNTGNVGMSWQHKAHWSAHFDVDYTLSASTYENKYFFEWNNQQDLPFTFKWNTKNRMADFQARFHHNWQVASNHRFSFGYQMTAQQASIFYADTNAVQSTQKVHLNDTVTQVLHTFYGEFAYRPSEKWEFTLGLRENLLPARGLYYSEPRLAFRWQPLGEHFTVKGGAGRYWQFVFQIQQFGDLGVGEPLWALAGNEIPPQRLWQWNLGASWQTSSLLVDVDFYLRKNRNLTSLNLELDSGVERPWVFDGLSNASGFDVLLRKRWHGYSLWLAWSAGKVSQRFASLNNGQTFPAPHDIRHNVDLIHMFKWRRWDLSVNLHFNTSKPYSEPVPRQVPCPNCTASTFTWELHYPTLNQQRLPATTRFDLGTSYRWKGRRLLKGKAGLAIYNLLNNRQVLDRDFVIETPPADQPQDEYNIQVLTRRASGAIPNLFVQFEW